jgi:hypothetical protein
MRFLLVLLAAAALAAPAGAALETVVLAPADDVSLPFLCSWGYDWEERAATAMTSTGWSSAAPATRSGARRCGSRSRGFLRARRS